MNWLDAMKDDDTVASTDENAARASVPSGTTSTAWDPHEVWLTRVKQPRDRAERRSVAGSVGMALESGADLYGYFRPSARSTFSLRREIDRASESLPRR